MAERLDVARLCLAVEAGRIQWQRHALERIAERGIARDAVKAALMGGEVIEDYPEAYPLPAALFLGPDAEIPLHVVAAFDAATETAYVVTAYEPTLEHFEPGFRRRKK